MILALGAAVNSHYDTPLMMAVANCCPPAAPSVPSSALRFLERWYRLALDRSFQKGRRTEEDNANANAAIRSVLGARNRSGESVLTLAWIAGMHEVISFLVRIDKDNNETVTTTGEKQEGVRGRTRPHTPIVTPEDVCQCKEFLVAMDRKWKSIVQSRRRYQHHHVKITTPKQHQQHKERYRSDREAVEKCALLMEAHLSERSERITRELLLALEIDNEGRTKTTQEKSNNNNSGGNSKNKKKRKSKKKEKGNSNQKQQEPDVIAITTTTTANNGLVSGNEEDAETILDSNVEGSTSSDYNKKYSDKNNNVLLTTLANGTVAVRVSGHHEGEDKVEPDEQSRTRFGPGGVIDLLPNPMTFRKRTMSLDETNRMLRDRYKQGSSNNNNHANNNSTHSYTSAAAADGDANNSSSRKAAGTKNGTAPTGATTTTADSNSNDNQRFSDADSVLSALCLDVGCLLYSDYGMALNLSPAQLDAVQQILEEQLQSVHKARAIQERRCKSAVATSSDRVAP